MSRDIPTGAKRIMVALDVDELSAAVAIAEELKGLGVTFKIGNQLGTYEGWQKAVEFARSYEAYIFCDTKFKDIPATVERSARSITRHQPDMFNIMADNNLAALRAAVTGAESAILDYDLPTRPAIIGVTVLTSISDEEAQSIYGATAAEKVMQFAEMAAEAGLDGLVCSGQEVASLRSNPVTADLLLVVPGIRPAWAATGDQNRVMTPREAIDAGADYLVIGRPITQPPSDIGSPRQAVEKILEELA